MADYICQSCGIAYTGLDKAPETCPICTDERHLVGPDGQKWTTLAEMQGKYHNEFRPVDDGLTGIVTTPSFGMGQRAILLQTPAGNLLWDPTSFVDEATIAGVKDLGGVAVIAVSHPHTMGSMAEWSRGFGNAKIYVNEADHKWVTAAERAPIEFWSGKAEVLPGVTLIQCGGHFPGSAVVHCQADSPRGAALLTGDTMQVVRDRRYLTFMWSYTNQIPLSQKEMTGISSALGPVQYERIFGTTWGNEIHAGGKAAVDRSAERYIRRINTVL
ncbi:MAG TPA: MBL fold metallo-hydrolase [Dehalococcoidia bacterium]